MSDQEPLYTNQPDYKGLPLLRGYAYNFNYLDRLLEVINRALMPVNRVLAVRLDLRFPQAYWPREGEILGNDNIKRFFRGLEQRLEYHRDRAPRLDKRRHPPYLQYVWAREWDQGETKPHYHIVLFVNRAAYRRLGRFSPGHHNLMTAAVESWSAALGLDYPVPGLVHVPENPCYVIERDSRAGIDHLLTRASYLCKLESKRSGDGCHRFGYSRS